ncbi:OmpH family outer membrane protein [Haloflavibacter putidus]|uniref:OmpH family outer membrane protein n=1 Tax=Haloflavibacter putidus TaxID=2576776 RepID=A0A507ZPF6_9FLAO|nr:OmpH family outer membrane protein [Haloflavibacter putidus]TQD39646.1 OmpH family outer membrane protein [Haloflavibacter putidus]
MKQFKTLLIAVSIILGGMLSANAQDSKVAHIATQELIESMPEYQAAMSQLEKLQNTYTSDIDDLMKEAQNKNKQYQAEASTKTDEENAARAQELQATQQKIMQYRQNAQQELQKKENELIRPILEKARTAIQKVARQNNYDYVLDSTTGTGVILADGYNLMNDVQKELGI